MKRIAVLDIGTNTFKMLIVDTSDGDIIKEVTTLKFPVKLAKEGIKNKIISYEAIERALRALNIFKSIIDYYEVKPTNVFAIATSGIRSAINGDDLLKTAFDETGIVIEVITGIREAELVYKATRKAVQFGKDPVLIVDIGGGSAEFIIGNNEKIFWSESFHLGAARLLERFKHSSPISNEEIIQIENYVEKELEPLSKKIKEYNINHLVGCSGSFSAFAFLITGKACSSTDALNVPSLDFTREEFERVHNRLLKTTKEEREEMKEINDARVEMIVISSILINFILEKCQIKRISYSAFSLRHGLIEDKIGISNKK